LASDSATTHDPPFVWYVSQFETGSSPSRVTVMPSPDLSVMVKQLELVPQLVSAIDDGLVVVVVIGAVVTGALTGAFAG
jgi:hypothetical protein